MARRNPRVHGFTLVELLVALLVLAVLAGMSWRGLDAMARARSQISARSDAILAVQTGLLQWGADLDAMATLAPLGADGKPAPGVLDWNGQVLRWARYSALDVPLATNGSAGAADAQGAEAERAAPATGLRVVAWSVRAVDGQAQWLRWQSDVLHTQGDLAAAWAQAAVWAQNPDAISRQRELALLPLAQWHVFYYRKDAWTNPLSSTDANAPTPDGIRLVLERAPGAVLGGTLTRDWMRATLGGNKS